MVHFVKEFENYIISDKSEDSLSSLIPESESQIYMSIINLIQSIPKDNKVPDNLYKLIEKFERKCGKEQAKEIKLLAYLKEYDLKTTNPEKKSEIIKYLKTNFFSNIYYNYPQPRRDNVNIIDTTSTKELSSKLDQNVLDPTTVFNKKGMKCITDSIINERYLFKMMKLRDIKHEEFYELINNYDYLMENMHLTAKLTDEDIEYISGFMIKNVTKLEQNTNVLDKVYKHLTTSHLELLYNKTESISFSKLNHTVPSEKLIMEIIRRKFNNKLKNLDAEDHASKREVFLQIYELIKSKKHKFDTLKADTLLHILQTGINLKIYDLALFKEYLNYPAAENHNQYDKHTNEKCKGAHARRQNICNFSPIDVRSIGTLVEKYLNHFFLHEKLQMKEFATWFNSSYLLREYQKAQVLLGEENEEMIKNLGRTYESLVKDVQISICTHNKNTFKVEEPVSIEIDIKNIQTLFVKIFEINTENYYYSKKQPISSDISLEGLIATYEDTFVFNEKPQKLIRRKFEFDKIPLKRGFFIVEMIGGGISSRAIIKKGGLSLITRNSPAGKKVYIINENSEICKSESSGLWVKDQFYKVNTETGIIVIPNQRSQSDEKAIMIHDGFAEIATIHLIVENYNINGVVMLNHESLIMGNTAKVLIKPNVRTNGRAVSAKLLQNPKVTLDLVKFENDSEIPIQTIFDKLKINDQEELEIEFQVPPKLVSVGVIFDADIKNRSKDKNENLTFQENFKLKTFLEDTHVMKYYLRNCEGNYYLSILGKNGEPKKKMQVKINLNSSVLFNIEEQRLQTNDDGEINLGELKNILSLNVNASNCGNDVSQFFELSDNIQINHPTTINCIVGEKVKIPINPKSCKSDIYLLQSSDMEKEENIDIHNRTNLIKFNKYDDNHEYIEIEKMEKGYYRLCLDWSGLYNQQDIDIYVHDGKYWGESNNFIVLKDKIIEGASNDVAVHLEKFNVNNDYNEITMKVNKEAVNPRVHLFAFQFLHSQSSENIKKLFENRAQDIVTPYGFQKWKNLYLSNRVLNEEIQYVFDRKQLERLMGNSLDKPSLLMQRQFLRDTNTTLEVIKEGTSYEKMAAPMMYQSNCMRNADRNYECSNKMMRRSMESCDNIDSGYGNRAMAKLICVDEHGYSSFHDFFVNSPLVLTNIVPDDNNEIKITNIDLTKYSHVQAIVIDDNRTYEEKLNLKLREVEKKDQTLASILDINKNFSELRKTELLNKTQSFNITDISSTAFKIIDSLEKYVSYVSIVSPYITDEWKNFNFILKFEDLSEDEKIKKLSNFFSHELNLFLYFKFPKFFDQYVKQILKYKSEKTFVDFFLLNDVDAIGQFCTTSRVHQLNSFEQCLLIYAIRKTNPEFATYIKNNLQVKANEIVKNANELKRLFTILMNMKIDDEKVVEHLEKIEMVREMDYVEKDCMMRMDSEEVEEVFETRGAVNLCAMPGGARPQPMMKKAAPRLMAQKKMGKMKAEPFKDDYSDDDMKIEEANIKNNLFKENGKSKEFSEMHYYNKNFKESYSTLINPNLFWADLANYWLTSTDTTLSTNFLSKWIILPSSNITEFMGILSVVDLPILSKSHKYDRTEGRGLKITPVSNIALFTKEITETKENLKSNLLIAQHVTIKNKPKTYNEVDDDDSDNAMDNLLVNDILNIETIITNISSKRITFELLIQIPQRSLPVNGSEFTKTINYSLDPFKTQKFDTYIYFPKSGKFPQFPPTASIDGIVVSKAKSLEFNIQEKIVRTTLHSLDDVLESGSKKDIIDFFVKSTQIKSSHIPKIYWLMNEKEVFLKMIDLLRKRGIFDQTIWNFGLLHEDSQTIKEILEANLKMKKIVGPNFSSSLININNTNNYDVLPHFDYDPIINSRVHRLSKGDNAAIMNNEFKNTYQEFIIYLLRCDVIDDKSYLRLCYYLILQDRIEEADRMLKKIKPDNFTEMSSFRIQYDYIVAYIDFSYSGYPEFNKAKEIFKKYRNFPLNNWNELFETIEDQLIEYEGKQIIENTDEISDENKKKKAKVKNAILTEPKLGFTVENKALQIIYSNISQITVKYYYIDLEILFSRTPFIKQNSEDFSFVQPNLIETVKLENTTEEKIFIHQIPEKFLSKNLFIEINSTSKKIFDTYFSTSLKTTIIENMGELKVVDEKLKSLPKTYVKCYAEFNDKSVKFYKDGYTDLRGKFNYVSLNTDQLFNVKRYSILVMHDELGSMIKECSPPSNISKKIDDVGNQMSQYQQYQNYRQEQKTLWRSQNKR